ncbi:hypothetical protein LINPERHAP1_LOCUS36504 [Linum perenne]
MVWELFIITTRAEMHSPTGNNRRLLSAVVMLALQLQSRLMISSPVPASASEEAHGNYRSCFGLVHLHDWFSTKFVGLSV